MINKLPTPPNHEKTTRKSFQDSFSENGKKSVDYVKQHKIPVIAFATIAIVLGSGLFLGGYSNAQSKPPNSNKTGTNEQIVLAENNIDSFIELTPNEIRDIRKSFPTSVPDTKYIKIPNSDKVKLQKLTENLKKYYGRNGVLNAENLEFASLKSIEGGFYVIHYPGNPRSSKPTYVTFLKDDETLEKWIVDSE